MKAPFSRHKLQTFLDVEHYMDPFISNLSSQSALLQELLEEKNEFKWSLSHQVSFDKVKESIGS